MERAAAPPEGQRLESLVLLTANPIIEMKRPAVWRAPKSDVRSAGRS